MGKRKVNRMNFQLGEILKLHRERAKMTQAQVAKILDVTPETIYNYETNRSPISFKKLLKFRKIYGDDFDRAIKIISENNGKFTGQILFKN